MAAAAGSSTSASDTDTSRGSAGPSSTRPALPRSLRRPGRRGSWSEVRKLSRREAAGADPLPSGRGRGPHLPPADATKGHSGPERARKSLSLSLSGSPRAIFATRGLPVLRRGPTRKITSLHRISSIFLSRDGFSKIVFRRSSEKHKGLLVV